ncbi:MAG TPA: GNAT family N-acetyltransferase [Verrucomicrobiae bacterium]|nr:GNAT family N-acetyltransferase [Verrucomicrobiae bacterium]
MVRTPTNINRETRIRPMVEGDAEVVAELATELGFPNEIEAIHRRIRPIGQTDLLLVVADASDKPVGFIQAHRVCIIEVGFRVEILGLVVSSSARRKGIARMLIGEVELWAQKIGAEVVSVRSNTKRAEAHLFYPAMGYKQIKTQAVYEKRPGGRESKKLEESEK